MRVLRKFKKLIDFDFVLAPGERAIDSNNILLHKGNQLHEIFIYINFLYGLFFTALNYYNGFPFAAFLTFIIVPLSIIAYVLYSSGYIFLSKIWNTFQQIIVVSLITLTSSPAGGTTAFLIPIATGILITFQGTEKKVGFFLVGITILTGMVLLTTDYRLGIFESTPENLKTEQLLNYTGATIATILELIFILQLSDSFQDKLMVNSRQLIAKNKELIKANGELDNFVYRVSHDLRSPLLSVKGLLSLVFGNPDLDKKSENYLRRAEVSINRLDDTIREILEYSRNSRLSQKLELFDLSRMVQLIFDDLRYLAGPDFDFRLKMETPNEVYSDGYRVNTVMRNLISNAVKYRRKNISNPFVDITVRQSGKNLLIITTDNGEGIPANYLPRVFDMFFRGSHSEVGTGLGLYICKEVIEKMNGTISIQSVHGEGTTITVELPLKKPA
ncbi:MAG: sensor histidine kinase [Bacteroidota bacterium]|jgi:signal transduction histidine kinase